MPFIDLPLPPPAPQRTDDPEIFIERADAFVAWQEAFATTLNVFVAQLEAAAALIAAAPAYADPGLAAMTGNAPAADRLIYLTGSSSSALATITGWARALLADANALDAMDTLGINEFTQNLLIVAQSQGDWRFHINAASNGNNNDIGSLRQDVGLRGDGTPSPATLGFRGLPVNYRGSAYELTIEDIGRIVPIAGGGITIPGGLPEGFACSLYNDSGSAQSVSLASGTMYLAGTALTGVRSLLQHGVATVVKVKSDTWVISGAVA